MKTGLADFTPFHSLAGGLMMASSLHTLLSKLGLVLGISGFFHSTVSSTVGALKGSSPASQSSIFPLAARYFTAGILTGGVILGLSRNWVEAGLGVSILDEVTNVNRASLLKLAGLGAIVGFGTKVCAFPDLFDLCGECEQLTTRSFPFLWAFSAGQRLYVGTLPLRTFETVTEVARGHCDLLWCCRRHPHHNGVPCCYLVISHQDHICQPSSQHVPAA